jgi:hypothetical protein
MAHSTIRDLSREEYSRLFDMTVTTPSDLATFAERAVVTALDTRKFEITLYWQRTAYIWAMIAAAFAGYFAVGAKEKSLAALSLACLGFVLSLAWYRLNQGSKFWQENWEQHVALLERDHFGPLFSTVLCRPRRSGFPLLKSAAPISVSKVNLFISVYIAFVWLVLIVFQLLPLSFAAPIDWYAVAIVVGSVAVSTALLKYAGTTIGSHGVQLTRVEDAP